MVNRLLHILYIYAKLLLIMLGIIFDAEWFGNL